MIPHPYVPDAVRKASGLALANGTDVLGQSFFRHQLLPPQSWFSRHTSLESLFGDYHSTYGYVFPAMLPGSITDLCRVWLVVVADVNPEKRTRKGGLYVNHWEAGITVQPEKMKVTAGLGVPTPSIRVQGSSMEEAVLALLYGPGSEERTSAAPLAVLRSHFPNPSP